MQIEVVFAEKDKQSIVVLTLPANSTIRDAIISSKLFTTNLETLHVGIFGRLRSLDNLVEDGDRVEIYRKLLIDPKDARVLRVKNERRAKRSQKHSKKQTA